MRALQALYLTAAITASASQAASAAVTFFDSKTSFDAATDASLIETFDGFTPTDVAILAPIVRSGATYTSLDAFPLAPNLVVTNAATPYGNFGTSFGTLNASVLTSSGNEDLLVSFASAQSAVGFEGYLNGLGDTTVQVLNGATVLDTLVLSDVAGGGLVYVGVLSDIGITGFRWTAVGGGALNSGIDSISVQAVPLPPALLLFGAGLPLLARRKARRA